MSDLELAAKAVFATLLGLAIGYQRSRTGADAGLRTFALVSLGSCVFTMLAVVHGGAGAPFAGAVISGIGFLGGGMILRAEETKTVRGLTTAAGVWASAGVGMAVGFDHFLLAGVLALLVLGLFVSGRWLNRGQDPDGTPDERPGSSA